MLAAARISSGTATWTSTPSARVRDPDPEVRAYFIGKMMRQAKPDDVFTFVTVDDIAAQFSLITRYLGHSREFWNWLLERWGALPRAV